MKNLNNQNEIIQSFCFKVNNDKFTDLVKLTHQLGIVVNLLSRRVKNYKKVRFSFKNNDFGLVNNYSFIIFDFICK
jgi:hypothetical protein